MESLYIAPGNATPEIRFDTENSVLFISGQSYPADPLSFYKPVFDWLDKYLSEKKLENGLHLSFKLDYYNTPTSKQFARLFKMLENSYIRDKVKINWFYDDNDLDMMEAGQRYSSFNELKFEIMKNLQN